MTTIVTRAPVSHLERRVASLERAAQTRASARIASMNATELVHELATRMHGADVERRSILRHASMAALQELCSDAPWFGRLSLAELRRLRDGTPVVGPMPPGITYR